MVFKLFNIIYFKIEINKHQQIIINNTMERRLHKKIDTYIRGFKKDLSDEIQASALYGCPEYKEDVMNIINFVYEYKNDCLAASIEYNKDFYSDRDVKPDESIFFKLTIIPLGESSSPNFRK